MKALVQPLSSVPPKRGVSLPALAQEASALAELGVMARETLGDRVTAELRKLLVAGRLAPGDKLSLRKVAEAVGVSMMPVREAVSRLAADGALEVLPGRAVRVPVMSLAQFRELTRIRLVVEGFAAEEAARRATPEAIGEIARFEAAFRAGAVADVPDASFGKAGASKPDAKPGATPLVAATPQRRATGLVLAPETIVTAEAALKGCANIAIAGENNAPKIPAKLARRLDGTGLMVLNARAGRAQRVRTAAPANGAAVLVPRDMDGELLASAAMLDGPKAGTSLQEAGAGAALFDKAGAFVGVTNVPPVSKFRVPGVVPTLSYAFLPAADVLRAAGLLAGAGGAEAAGKSSAEIAELARPAIVSLVCASDK